MRPVWTHIQWVSPGSYVFSSPRGTLVGENFYRWAAMYTSLQAMTVGWSCCILLDVGVCFTRLLEERKSVQISKYRMWYTFKYFQGCGCTGIISCTCMPKCPWSMDVGTPNYCEFICPWHLAWLHCAHLQMCFYSNCMAHTNIYCGDCCWGFESGHWCNFWGNTRQFIEWQCIYSSGSVKLKTSHRRTGQLLGVHLLV